MSDNGHSWSSVAGLSEDEARIMMRFELAPLQWVRILRGFTADDRLRALFMHVSAGKACDIKCSQPDIAAAIACSREQANRTLNYWRRHGLIDKRGSGKLGVTYTLLPRFFEVGNA